MTIITQDEVFVNYDHVAKIAVFGDVVEDEEVGAVDVAVLKAHLDTGKKVVLGVYAEADQLDEVLKELTQWLGKSSGSVFTMPSPQVYVDETDMSENSEVTGDGKTE